MTPDIGNAIFEGFGAFFIWKSVFALWKDREIKGVYWPAWIFYSAWGVWNLWYYPAIGQIFSFLAGIAVVTGNIAWVTLAVRFRVFQRAPVPLPEG
jgi:hypothetical protein